MRIGHAEMAVKRASEKAKSERVFGRRRKRPKMFRVALYARVSTHDQQTIPLQIRAMRQYAATRGWTIALQVKGSRIRRFRTRTAAEADQCSPSARDRHRSGLASGPLGPLAAGSGDNTRRTESPRRWVRVADRSTGPGYTDRTGHGRPAFRLLRLNARSCANVCGPASSMPGKTASDSVGQQRRRSNRPKSESSIASASVKPRSPED